MLSKIKLVTIFCCTIATLSLPCETLLAETYPLPAEGDGVVGELQFIKARYEDTFSDIARRYSLGYNELVLANPGIDPWLPGEGSTILLPTYFVLPDAPREGVVLNVPEMRLYFYPETAPGEQPVVITYPASVGRAEWNTPLGTTKVTRKQINPTWFPPASIRREHAENGELLGESVPPGPDNPLGAHAVRLAIPGYLIHGTNEPNGIGMRATHGCVRLYPEDIAMLFHDVIVGTEVHIVNQPYKAGWRDGSLYFEAHPPLEEDAKKLETNRTPAINTVVAADNRVNTHIMWDAAMAVIKSENGSPTVISTILKEDTNSVMR